MLRKDVEQECVVEGRIGCGMSGDGKQEREWVASDLLYAPPFA